KSRMHTSFVFPCAKIFIDYLANEIAFRDSRAVFRRVWCHAESVSAVDFTKILPVKGGEQALDLRIGAGAISARVNTFLRKLRNAPVFFVRDIPEFDCAGWIEIRPRHSIGMKQPFTKDRGLPHFER